MDGSLETRRTSLTECGPSDFKENRADSLRARFAMPWLKQQPEEIQISKEDQAVDRFMDKYVVYPCNETSSPGFLEHLPCLFKEVNIEGRYALRWAVQAAAYADLARDSDDDQLARRALHCYSMALSALGKSLAEPGKTPDDYDLMAVVVLDVFEVGLSRTIVRVFYSLSTTDSFSSRSSKKRGACSRDGSDSEASRTRPGL